MPHHRGSTRKHRLPQILFQHLQYRQCRHPGAAEEDGFGVLSVDQPRQSISPLGGLVVDIGDPLQIDKIDDLQTVRFQMRLPCNVVSAE